MRYKFASALVMVLAISTCFGAATHRFLWEAGEYRLTQAQVADRFESVGKAGVYFNSETDIHRWGGPFDLSKERFVAAGKVYVDSVAAALGKEVSYFPDQVWLLPQARIACFFGAAGTLPAVVHNVVSLLDQLAGYIEPALSYSAHHRTAMVAFLKELLAGSAAGSEEDALRILVADYATYALPGAEKLTYKLEGIVQEVLCELEPKSDHNLFLLMRRIFPDDDWTCGYAIRQAKNRLAEIGKAPMPTAEGLA